MSPPNEHRLNLDSPSLVSDPNLAVARRLLEAYTPVDAAQETVRTQMLNFIAEHPSDAHLRSCLTGHLTASALVTDSRQRVLLLHHRKLSKWLQPGGHCDGDANLPGVALREAIEESGIEGLEVVPSIIDLDIHRIPARGDVPEHLHLDTRYLVIAPPGAEPRGNHESNAVQMMSLAQAHEVCEDASLERMLRHLETGAYGA